MIIQNVEVSQETHSSGGGERGRTGSGLDDLLCRPLVARKLGYTKRNMGVRSFIVADQEYLVFSRAPTFVEPSISLAPSCLGCTVASAYCPLHPKHFATVNNPPTNLMAHHRLHLLAVPIALRLQRVKNLTHLLLLPSRQLDIPRRKVLFQTVRLSRARDRDHALRHHPRQSYLRQSASFTLSQSLDLLDDLLVVVEVLALEFGDCKIC